MNNGRLTRVSGVPDNVPALFAANCYTLSPTDVLGDAVAVGRYAFANAEGEVLVLAPSLLYIDTGAFAGMTGVTSINAESLLGNPPAVEEDAFSGMEPSAVTLHVAKDCESPWREHPVWSLFNITSSGTVAVDTVGAETGGIDIRIAGDVLVITAPASLTSAAIYSADGGMVADVLSNAYTASSDGSVRLEYSLSDIAERLIIVAAATAEGKASVKVLR